MKTRVSFLISFIVLVTSSGSFFTSDSHAQSLPTTAGWHQIPNTRIRSHCPDPSKYTDLIGTMGCEGVTLTWSGGAFDTARNRLLIRGGGHNGYFGNEIYAFNLNTLTMERLYEPSRNPPTTCSNNGKMPDGKPQGSHTYNHVEYLPGPDKFFEWGGGGVPCGNFEQRTWTMSASTYAWQDMASGGTPPTPNFGRSMVYDPNTTLVWARDAYSLYSYNYNTNVWTNVKSDQALSDYKTGVIDTKRHWYYIVESPGGGSSHNWFRYDITPGSNYAVQQLTVTGCNWNHYAPGMAYDPLQDRIVVWDGGNTVYLFNPQTNSCNTVSYPGGPAKIQYGTFGRFRYSPTSNVFVVVNSVDDDAYVLRLSSGGAASDTSAPSVPGGLTSNVVSSTQITLSWNPASDNTGVTGYKVFRNGTQITTVSGTSYSDTGLVGSTTYTYTVSAYDAAGNNSAQSTAVTATTTAIAAGDPDFQKRCTAAGVIQCMGFDSLTDFTPATYPNSGLYPAGDGQFRGTMDTTTKASGNGSLKFTIPGGSDANSAGFWWQKFGQSFAQGQSFYVQFRQRFDSSMLNLKSGFGGGGWKQVIFHSLQGGSCASLEITTNNLYYSGFPRMYTNCGAQTLDYGLANGDVVIEYSNAYPPGSDGPIYCLYRSIGNPSNKCFYYQPDQWLTFYYRVTIGTWGQPNSTIQAWAGYEGQPLAQIVNRTNYILTPDAPGLGFDILMLTPFDTGKDGRNHTTANTWYDELIVSTQPIAPPGGSPNPPPAAPANLRVQ